MLRFSSPPAIAKGPFDGHPAPVHVGGPQTLAILITAIHLIVFFYGDMQRLVVDLYDLTVDVDAVGNVDHVLEKMAKDLCNGGSCRYPVSHRARSSVRR